MTRSDICRPPAWTPPDASTTSTRSAGAFDFPEKSGQRRVQAIAGIAALERRRSGAQLLAYRENGGWHELSAEEVNAYLKEHFGDSFPTKDFRTWNATVLAAVALAGVDGTTAGAREREVKAVKTVAAILGNTRAVCRASYIDPRVLDRFHAGVTIAPALDGRLVADLGSQGPARGSSGLCSISWMTPVADVSL